MIKSIIFLILIGVGSCADFQSIPKSLLTSTAYFGGFSNEPMTSWFLDCESDNFSLFSVDLTFKTTGKIDICKNSSVIGACSEHGDTSTSTAIEIDQFDKVILGFSGGSYAPAELTTSTKIDGSFVAQRSCVTKDYLK